MTYRLAINTGFAVNRYSEPEEWIKIVGEDLNLRYAQLTADMLNASLPSSIINNQISRINAACKKYNIQISSTFTGAFTRVNHLAHPDKEMRDYWVKWFKKYADISVAIGAKSMGSHFGIFTAKDNNDKKKREERRRQNIEAWHEIGVYAKKIGLEFLSWEPMSISREQGETLAECRRLHNDVNHNAPIDFKICLDVDHGDLISPNPDDTNPYAWLKHFAKDSPLIHLKQSSENKSGHWPFIKQYNDIGIIRPQKVIDVLKDQAVDDVDLILELSFKERQPTDSTVVEVLKESVEYWRDIIKD